MTERVYIERPCIRTFGLVMDYLDFEGIDYEVFVRMAFEREVERNAVYWRSVYNLSYEVHYSIFDQSNIVKAWADILCIPRKFPPECTCDCHFSRWITESEGKEWLGGMAFSE